MATQTKKKVAADTIKIPARYTKREIPKVIKLLINRGPADVAKRYNISKDTLKKDIAIFRKLGYIIPRLVSKAVVTEPKSVKRIPVIKKNPKPKKELLPNKVVDISKMKWIRIDKRTLIQVDKKMDDKTAIEQYLKRRSDSQRLNNRGYGI